eukprot:709390-Pleurochrysis_carterae.AAC.2
MHAQVRLALPCRRLARAYLAQVWDQAVFDRIQQGICAVLLALKKRPLIRRTRAATPSLRACSLSCAPAHLRHTVVQLEGRDLRALRLKCARETRVASPRSQSDGSATAGNVMGLEGAARGLAALT